MKIIIDEPNIKFSSLIVEHVNGNRILAANLHYNHTDSDGTVEPIRVPTGFVTDFASIPRVAWAILPPFGRYERAAVVHDWICHVKGRVPRAYVYIGAKGYYMATGGIYEEDQSQIQYRVFTSSQAADIFEEGMRVSGVSWFVRKCMARAVRLFGPRF